MKDMFKKIYEFILSNKILTAIFIAGISLRLIFFLHAYKALPVSTDEALPGLMAKHILDGEFPAVYWWPTYLGAMESFFQSVLIYLFGTTAFSVRFYLLLVGILFIFVTFKLADEMFNRNVAIISAALISIPAVYLPVSMTVSHNYLETILMGSLSLLLLHRIVYKPISENQRTRYYLLLGLISGLGFWVHILYIGYIAVILLFFFIHDKLFFLRKNFLICLLFFIIGSSPLIFYNMTHNFDTFHMAKGIDFHRALLNLSILFMGIMPVLFGMRLPTYVDSPNTLLLPNYLGLILGIVYVIALLYIIISRWKNILGIITFSAKRIGPIEMFLVFIVINIIIFIRTDRSMSWSVRYFLPVISVVPILLSVAIYNMGKRYKTLAGVILGIVLIIQVYGNARVYAAWGMPEYVDKYLDLPDDRALISFLDSRGITKTYAHYWISYRLTYETGERIICAPPIDERFGGKNKPRYTDEVDRSSEVAFIFHQTMGLKYDLFEENVRGIGISYKTDKIGPYTVFYDFISPQTGEPISTADWIAESNYSPDDVKMAFDGSISTRWATKSPQKPGGFFLVDLAKKYMVSGVSMFLGEFWTDCPRGIIVEISRDKKKWDIVARLDRNIGMVVLQNSHPIFETQNKRNEFYFKPNEARYVKITQTGHAYPYDWSIAELYVYQHTP